MLTTPRTAMHTEAGEAASAVRRQITLDTDRVREAAQRLRALDPPLVLTCARGSSDHAGTYGQYLISTALRLPAFSLPPSIGSVLDATSPRLAGAVVVLISQSGMSPDLLRSAAAARAAGATLAGLVNDGSSPLAEMADILLPLRAGRETSVAATKSFIASLAALLRLVAAWSGAAELDAAVQALPDALDVAWRADWSAAEPVLHKARGLFVLGRGLTLGPAQEAALKFKETSGLHAEAFSTAEVAHGPMALVGPDMPVLVFPPEGAAAQGLPELVAGFIARGAKVMVAGGGVEGALALPLAPAHPAVRPILAVQSFYRLVEAVSVARGHDPDRPPSLAKVTRTL